MVETSSIYGRLFSEAFNRDQLDVVYEVVAATCIAHNLSRGQDDGRRSLKQLINILRAGFPDLACRVEAELRGQGHWAARWDMCGTHQGAYLGNPPTCRKIQVSGMIFARIEQEVFLEIWLLVDRYGLLQQLGILP